MTINKSYSININSTNKYVDGQQNYLPLSIKTTTAKEIDSELQPSWSSKYSDGLIPSGAIKDGLSLLSDTDGIYSIFDTVIDIDGTEYYSSTNEIYGDRAYILKRNSTNLGIYLEFIVEEYIDNKYLKIKNMSSANLGGSKLYIDRQSESTVGIAYSAHVLNSLEKTTPKIQNGKTIITSKYCPLGEFILAYHDNGISVVDISSNIELIMYETGEIIINGEYSNVGIYYFIRPIMFKPGTLQPMKSPTDEYKFISINGERNMLFTDYSLSENILGIADGSISTLNTNSDALIEFSSPIMMNGKKYSSIAVTDNINISSPLSLQDNLFSATYSYSVDLIVDNPTVTQDTINVAVYGVFVDQGEERLSLMAVGTTDASDVNPILDGTYSSPIGTDFAGATSYHNYLYDFSIPFDKDKYGYRFALPSWVDENTLSMTQDDGISQTAFTGFSFIAPDIIVINKNMIVDGVSYVINYSSAVSPIVDDVSNSEVKIKCSNDPFVLFTGLTEIRILANRDIDIVASNIDSEGFISYYSNSEKITIKPSRNYIAKKLGEYKTLLLNEI